MSYLKNKLGSKAAWQNSNSSTGYETCQYKFTASNDQRATLLDIRRFFAVKNERAARAAAKRLGIRIVGRTVPWRQVFHALNLDDKISGEDFQDLTRPLVTPCELAAQKHVDPETVYRWLRDGSANLPAPVHLGPRGTRWIRAEIEAWEGVRTAKTFPRRAPKSPFGTLKPAPQSPRAGS